MNITLRGPNGNPIDVTKYLDEESEQTLNQDLERRAFQRTFGDIHLRLSNLRKVFSDLFRDTRSSTRWLVSVFDNDRCLFRGFVKNKSIVIDTGARWCDFDAFSQMRAFVDSAKQTRVYVSSAVRSHYVGPTPKTDFVALGDLLEFQRQMTGIDEGGLLFSGFDLGEYVDRPIRGWTNAVAPIGVQGRFCDLNRTTTWDILLQAMSKYYNAEFFIDADTAKLTMRRRGMILNDRKMDIDPFLKDDLPPQITIVEEGQIDYLYAPHYKRHPIPQVRGYYEASSSIVIGGMKEGWHAYVMTSVIDGTERMRSDPVEFVLPAYVNHPWRVNLRLPASFAGVQERRVYRRNAGTDFRLVPILTQKNNDECDLVDWYQEDLSDQDLLRPLPSSCRQWVRFDEESGLWEEPILDIFDGMNAPRGEILEITPGLEFMEPAIPNHVRDFDPFDVFCFFGQEDDYSDTRILAQWESMFRVKRGIACLARNTDYRIGDGFYSNGKLFPDDLRLGHQVLVRHAENNFTKKETELVLLTI